jgi:threonine/homoserine/homoserine lactone efflux protein
MGIGGLGTESNKNKELKTVIFNIRHLQFCAATFLLLAAINATLYAAFAGYLRETVQNSRARRWFNCCGGNALIGAAVFTAAIQRSS